MYQKVELYFNPNKTLRSFHSKCKIGTCTCLCVRVIPNCYCLFTGSNQLKVEGQPKCHNMFLQYYWKNKEVPFHEGQRTMHYGQTTDESVCCQIFPGMLPDENHNKFDVTNISFWLEEPNPWEIIFNGYKKGIKPGKQVNCILTFRNFCILWNERYFLI